MKKFWTLVFLLIGLSGVTATQAQVNVNINLGSQPQWGPVGYQAARYYYLPELNIYYDVNNSLYVYPKNNSWKKSKTLPSQYRNIDLYRSYKVVINEKNPWKKNNYYVSNYGHYKNNHSQVAIKYANNGGKKQQQGGYDRPGQPIRKANNGNVDSRNRPGENINKGGMNNNSSNRPTNNAGRR